MTIMPSDPPSPTTLPHPHPHTLTQRPITPHRAQATLTPCSTPRATLSPAQAIAQAWMRELPEAQAQWRKADVRAQEQYTNPIRWNTGRPEKKRIGAKM
ncbi:hypothetical protein LXA43DRAFT_1090675 [Ganoderma leucocontextum]|nr:hypothetical protein LXA43DRAFT_1090675 [Ganoderma leucocontextum]